MRRILGIAAILTGVASVSAAETSYKACAIDGRLGFFSITEVGDFVEINIVGSAEEPFIRPANSPLLIEVDGEVLVFGDDKATLIQGDELTQLDCFWIYANQVTAFNAEASEMAAELERHVQILNEQAVELRREIATLQAVLDIADQADTEAKVQIESLGDQLDVALEEAQRHRLEAVELRRQINTDLSVENENLQGRLAEVMVELAAWRAEATAARAIKERAAESERQVTLLNAQLVEARRQIDRLRNLLDLADRAKADAKVQIESLLDQLTAALAEAQRLRLEAAD